MSGPIDLSQLAPPTVVETLDFESIFSDMLNTLKEYAPTVVEGMNNSDPAWKVLQVAAYRELLVRQRVNEAAKSVMLAYAKGMDLDHLGALFNVQRLEVVAGNSNTTPPIPAINESDDEYRRRIQLSLEGFSVAGPEGAYRYHAMSVDGQVLDASATSPAPGEVVVTVLSRLGDGTANADLLEKVHKAVGSEAVRPLTDAVTVRSAHIVPYTVKARLYCYEGPDSTIVLENAHNSVSLFTQEQHFLGRSLTRSGLYAALHQPGVQRVELLEPAALAQGQEKIEIDALSASYCTQILLSFGGVDG